MRKEILTGIAVFTLAFTVLTGCGNKQEVESASSKAETEALQTQSEETGTAEASLLETVRETGVLKIGTEGTYAPFTFHDENNKLVGFDVEVAEKVAEKLGVKAEFVETKWDSIIAGLDAERFDVVINQVSITEERLEKYDFSIPYSYTHGALIVKGSNEEITDFDQIAGKKAAQSLTSNWGKLAEEKGAELVSTDGFNQSVELVLAGRADLTLNDDLTYYDYLNQKPDADLKIVALSDDTSASAVMIRKGNEDLVQEIDKALKELADEGVLSEISEKYFVTDVTKE